MKLSVVLLIAVSALLAALTSAAPMRFCEPSGIDTLPIKRSQNVRCRMGFTRSDCASKSCPAGHGIKWCFNGSCACGNKAPSAMRAFGDCKVKADCAGTPCQTCGFPAGVTVFKHCINGKCRCRTSLLEFTN